jgi:hypothetical protein
VELREIARAQRKRHVEEALQFERDRERALRDQLEETVTELEGPAVDEEVFAKMAPRDVEIVREALLDSGPAIEHGVDEEEDAAWLQEFVDDGSPEVERGERLGEVARLEEEIEGSRRRQQALERYLDALGVPSSEA